MAYPSVLWHLHPERRRQMILLAAEPEPVVLGLGARQVVVALRAAEVLPQARSARRVVVALQPVVSLRLAAQTAQVHR